MRIPAIAKRLARWMAYLGFLCGVLYAFGGLIIDLRSTGVNRGTAMAFMALLGMPLMFGVVGFVGGLLVNVMSRAVAAKRNREGH